MSRKILVTSALPYANGSIHIGHLVEYIQTDIWVRFQKMRGHTCSYVCADDTHGTAIMLRAEKEGITPQQLIDKTHGEHLRDFQGFHIAFDSYYSTNSEENRELSQGIYRKLRDKNLIEIRTIEQLYDPEKQLFLADRFIKGECPKCHAQDQYGDACEVCGTTYAPTELIKPYSAVSGATPIKKMTEQYFFKLGECTAFLQEWTRAGHLQNEAANKMSEWLDSGLQSWDISRNAPYFGFEIPDAPGKYFYVWLDAPIGYMASFQHLCTQGNLIFDDYWKADASTELYHWHVVDMAGVDLRKVLGVADHGLFLEVAHQPVRGARGDDVQQQEESEEQCLRGQHQHAFEPARTRDLNEGHQVHALVLGLVHQGADPAFVIAHPAQAAQVDQRRADHARHRGDSLQHDRSIAVALGKKRICQKSQAAGNGKGGAVRPVADLVVGVEGKRCRWVVAWCHVGAPGFDVCASGAPSMGVR